MDSREEIIRFWFDMWLQKKDLGILDIFSANVQGFMYNISKAGGHSIVARLKSSIGLTNGILAVLC